MYAGICLCKNYVSTKLIFIVISVYMARFFLQRGSAAHAVLLLLNLQLLNKQYTLYHNVANATVPRPFHSASDI